MGIVSSIYLGAALIEASYRRDESKQGCDKIMKAIVVFDTLYGNTKKIAESLTTGMQSVGIETDCKSIKQVQEEPLKLESYDFIAVGAPTQYITASKPMKAFLEMLEGIDLKGKFGFAFDTRIDNFFAGSASKYIEGRLRKYGLRMIMPRSSAYIQTTKSKKEEKDAKARRASAVLKQGTALEFEKLGEELGRRLLVDSGIETIA